MILLFLSLCSSLPSTATVTGPRLYVGSFPAAALAFFFSKASRAAFSSASKSARVLRIFWGWWGFVTVVPGGGGEGRRATSSRRDSGRRRGTLGLEYLLRRRMRLKGWEGSVGGPWRERVVEEVGERRPVGEGGSAEGLVVGCWVEEGIEEGIVMAEGASVDAGRGDGASF